MLQWYEPVWLAFFASAALKSTVVLAIAWVLTTALRGRSAAARHLVWTAALAGILALPFLSVGLPDLQVPVNLPSLTFHASVTDNADAETALRSTVLPPAQPQSAQGSTWRPDWALYVMALWAAGTIVALTQMLAASAVMARRRAKSGRYAEDFSGLADVMGLRQSVPILKTPPGTMPMTFGLWKPAIFLPEDAVDWQEQQRRMVVLHEMAHIRRGDLPAHLVARAALCFYWWNPMAWMAWRTFLKERERATDDLVLRTGARASDYAAHLLEVARSMQPAASIAWAAVAMARRSQLEGRLLAILDSGVNRRAIGRASLAAATTAAVMLIAPFAAMHAQNPADSTIPPDVDATIRAALSQKNHEILDNAAAAFERIRQYEPAQKLLETSLQVREQTSGQQSVDYGEGLAKLGDLAVRRGKRTDAMDFYSRAALAISDRPQAAHSLFQLGVLLMTSKQYDKAEESFRHMQTVDPSKAGEALTWIALTHERQAGPIDGLTGGNEAAEAESFYRQALAVENSGSPEAAVTQRLLARLLRNLGRGAEADQLTGNADATAAAGATPNFRTGASQGQTMPGPAVRPRMSPDAVKAGGGVAPPRLLYKLEPEYSEIARAAKYQGTVVLYIEVGPDGIAHNIQVTRSLGLGLDEKAIEAVSQWKFAPGTKDGQPVTVAATIEVNFRLL